MKFKLSKLSLALLSCTIGIPLNAQIVTPIFSGNYFVNASYTGKDSCLADQFSYDQIGGSINSLVLNYLNAHEPTPGCTWSVTSVNPSSIQGIPYDFPGLDSNEWQLAIQHNPNDVDMQADAACITPNKVIQNQATVVVSPHYICPPNSRLSLDENINPPQVGCTDTPMLCSGDVVGRDLNFPGAGALGHVGITLYTPTVMQVESSMINPMPLIDQTPFDSFKTASPYWGDKYGTSQYPVLTFDQGNAITDDGFAQETNSINGMYFLIPIFTPAQSSQLQVYSQSKNQWQAQYVFSVPLFRCDTFVDWIYYQALGEMLIPFAALDAPWNEFAQYSYVDVGNLPKDLFAALQNTRDNGNTVSSLGNQTLSVPQQNLLTQTTNYLLSNQISRQAKIDFYWQQLNQNLSDFQYLLDLNALTYLKPVSLIPGLMSDFQNTSNLIHKQFLLNVIISALQINPAYVQPQDQPAITTGQVFLASELATENNPQLLGMALYGYISVTPYDQNKASQVNTAITRLATMQKVDVNSLFVYGFLLDVNDPSGASLTQLISGLQGTQYQKKFTIFLSGLILNGLTQSMVPVLNQSAITSYLKAQINPILISDNANGEEAYRLIKAYGLFTNNPTYVADTILSTANLPLKADLILAAFDDPKAQATLTMIKNDRQEIVASFAGLNTANISQKDLMKIEAADNKLKS